jgi:hypothetical protein
VAAPDRVAARRRRARGDEDLAAPALDPAGAEPRAAAGRSVGAMLARRQPADDRADQAQRLGQLGEADRDPRRDVAGAVARGRRCRAS